MRKTTAFSLSRIAALVAALGAFVLPLSAAAASSTPPSIVGQSISGVTTSNAVLQADIIPGDWEGEFEGMGGAYYQFQLVADPSEYWPEVTCPEQHPESVIQCLGSLWTPPQASLERRPGDLPTEDLSGSYEVQSVWLDLQSAGVVLQPGTTYHYRVIAVEATPTVDTIEWNAPPVYGPDQTFTTPGLATPSGPVLSPPVLASPPAPPLPGPAAKPRCQRKKKKANFRRLGIQCRNAVAKPRRR